MPDFFDIYSLGIDKSCIGSLMLKTAAKASCIEYLWNLDGHIFSKSYNTVQNKTFGA